MWLEEGCRGRKLCIDTSKLCSFNLGVVDFIRIAKEWGAVTVVRRGLLSSSFFFFFFLFYQMKIKLSTFVISLRIETSQALNTILCLPKAAVAVLCFPTLIYRPRREKKRSTNWHVECKHWTHTHTRPPPSHWEFVVGVVLLGLAAVPKVNTHTADKTNWLVAGGLGGRRDGKPPRWKVKLSESEWRTERERESKLQLIWWIHWFGFYQIITCRKRTFQLNMEESLWPICVTHHCGKLYWPVW